jgi:hypothetical protein
MSHTNFSHKLEPFEKQVQRMADEKGPAFKDIAVGGPGFNMRFKATPERVGRIAAFLFAEAGEAEVEFQESLKAKNEAA